MKLLLVALALLAVSVRARSPVPRHSPPSAVCYTKTTQCCFFFSQCTTVTKSIPTSYDCSFNQCKPVCSVVCHPHCRLVKTHVPRLVCKRTHGRCMKVYSHHGWKKRCYRGRKVCRRVYKTVVRKVCRKKCAKKCVTKCHRIKAICRIVKTLVFPKYCPSLHCYKTVVTGSAAVPAAIVGTTAISTSVSQPTRTIIGKH